MLEVAARDRADAVRAEELVLVEHASQDPPQPVLVDERRASRGPSGLGPGQVGERRAASEKCSANAVDALDERGLRVERRRRRRRVAAHSGSSPTSERTFSGIARCRRACACTS